MSYPSDDNSTDLPKRTPIPKEIRHTVRHMFGECCAYCGEELRVRGWHVDHVIPLSAGGIDDPCNYFPSCATCNTFKNAFSLEQFRTILEEQTYKRAAFVLAERFGQITSHPKKIEFWFEKCGHKFDDELVRSMMKATERV